MNKQVAQFTDKNFWRRSQAFIRSITLSQMLMLALLTGVAVNTTGCKAKKEARAAAQARAERIAEARADLLAIINDNGRMSLEEKESELQRIKDMNIDDAEIQDLIARADAIVARERDAVDRVAESTGTTSEGTSSGGNSSSRLGSIFSQISASRSNSDANYVIREALNMFASPATPVLIIISEQGNQTDYDEPTTIEKYFQYLKDTNSRPASVENLVYDANGKIKEVVLIKNYR